jgi:3-methyladenine DNA glycosylase/8-oxoguanine DNA glycosylase
MRSARAQHQSVVRLFHVDGAVEGRVREERHLAAFDGNVTVQLPVGQLEPNAAFVGDHTDARVGVEAPCRCVRLREQLGGPFGYVDHATSLRTSGASPLVEAANLRLHVTTRLTLPLTGPGGEPVDLWRTMNSHGFAELAPTMLDEAARTLELTLRTRRGKPRRVRLREGRSKGAVIEILGPAAGFRVQEDVLAGVHRVLRLDHDLSGFYAKAELDPDLAWAVTGAGRMLQGPTVFEDVVKTICTTNCTWSATVRMVNAMVEHLGERAVGGDGPLTNAFPTPARMSDTPEALYRDVVRAGYRGAYLRSLARSVAEGDLDLEALARATSDELPDAELERQLLALPGVGPYAAAHIMMTIGRNSLLILDSWTRPKYARLVGRKSVSDTQIRRRFARYGDHAGLAFWLFVTRDWVA